MRSHVGLEPCATVAPQRLLDGVLEVVPFDEPFDDTEGGLGILMGCSHDDQPMRREGSTVSERLHLVEGRHACGGVVGFDGDVHPCELESSVVDEQHERARRVLRRRRAALVAISDKLLAKETLERDEIDATVDEAETAAEEAEETPSSVRPLPRSRPSV